MVASIKTLGSRIRSWFSRENVDGDFDQELSSHLEMLTQENIARGMSRDDATRAARIRLGGSTQLKETNRELRGLPMLETFFQDVRYALRMLRKNPGFAAVAILTLALGIGANTAIFSVVYSVLLKTLPFPDSGRLYSVFEARPQEGIPRNGWSYFDLEDLRAQNSVFTELAGSQSHQLTLTGRGEPGVVNTSVVTPELFTVFGVAPLEGRAFTHEDGNRGATPVVILSENLWRDQFASDPNVLGTQINLDKKAFTVIGIMPSFFRFPLLQKSEQVWIPLVDDPLFGSFMFNRGGHYLQVTGRLKPGVSVAQAQAELVTISERLGREYPKFNAGWTSNLVPFQQFITGTLRTPLLVLLGAVGLVLLIACVNIANLLLTRATSRSREIAVRTALGAGRGRIIRQLLNETAVLGLLGGILGIALAYWGVQALVSLLPSSVPQVNAIRVDHSVLAFALLLSLAASMAFGLAPAFFAANTDVSNNLREGGSRAGESSARRRMRSILAAAEIAIAMVLLVAAGLVLRSFGKLISVNPGFAVQHMVRAEVSLPRYQYSTPVQWANFSSELLDKVQNQPGMQDSAIGLPMPIVDGFVNLGFDIVGSPAPPPGSARTADYATVSPDYFRVMSIPLLAGRGFSRDDVMSTPRVTLISEALARAYFPNQNPIGRRLAFGTVADNGAPREIIGIVADIHDVSLGEDPKPMMYVPYSQSPLWGAILVVKTSMSAANAAAVIRQQVATMDKDLPISDVTSMPEILQSSVAQPRFRTLLLGLFATIALILAATGIFGVISYSVSRRTHEIGVRVALGASRAAILRMVLRETLTLVLAGLAIGIPCALAASHLMASLLFGISANDPVTLIAVAFALAAVATLAGYAPARRATRVDPLVALRHE